MKAAIRAAFLSLFTTQELRRELRRRGFLSMTECQARDMIRVATQAQQIKHDISSPACRSAWSSPLLKRTDN